jgi:dolichol kinase
MLFRLEAYFYYLGFMQTTPLQAMPVVSIIALVCTLIESLPASRIDDNISVPLAAAVLGYCLCSSASASVMNAAVVSIMGST